jgi:hypothetical protein
MQSYNFESIEKFTAPDARFALKADFSNVRILVVDTYSASDVVFLREDTEYHKNRFVCLENEELVLSYFDDEPRFYLSTRCFLQPVIILYLKEVYLDGDKAKAVMRTAHQVPDYIPVQLPN